MIGDLATRLAGPDDLDRGGRRHGRRATSSCARAASRPSPSRARRAAARGQGAGARSSAMREAAAISDRVFDALAEEQFTGRTERELAWRVRELFHEHGASELAFDTIVAAGRERRQPARRRPRRRDPGEHARHDRRRLPRRRLRVRLHAHVRDRRAAGRARRARTRSASRRSSPALDAYGPGVSGRDADAAARDVIAAAGWGEQFGHGLGHGIGLEVHEAPPLPRRVDRHPRGRATSSAASRASTSRASAASGSRTWCSSPTTAASALTHAAPRS